MLVKILVTGGLGFIGSNFIHYILKNFPDYEILNVDDEFHGSDHMNLKEFENNNRYQFVKGNITNFELMKKLIDKVNGVINFAAESHVDRSISNARPFIESNIMGVFTILEALKDKKKRFVQISTDEVFGSLKDISATENFVMNPSSPYSASKASAELLVNSYVITYGHDALITRCTNNYGPRQFLEKLIPKVIFLAKNNKKIPIYGTGKNVRDWIYVDDHCNAIMKVFLHGKSGESYNISTSNEIDNLTIVNEILLLLGKSPEMIEYVADRPGHDFRYSLDSSKIRNELGWKPQIEFNEGIKKTINWYMENKSWDTKIDENIYSKNPWK
jgi:dTDP-glucose 4,6-dehydratase